MKGSSKPLHREEDRQEVVVIIHLRNRIIWEVDNNIVVSKW